jgi:hypothetical protein
METPEFPTYTILQVAEWARRDVNELIGCVYLCGFVLALIPPVPLTWKGIFWRTAFVTLVVWYSLNTFRVFEVRWASIVSDLKRVDSNYDGVGGNVAVLVLGWIFPFVQCFGVLALIKLVVFAIQKYRAKPEPATPSASPSSDS